MPENSFKPPSKGRAKGRKAISKDISTLQLFRERIEAVTGKDLLYEREDVLRLIQSVYVLMKVLKLKPDTLSASSQLIDDFIASFMYLLEEEIAKLDKLTKKKTSSL